jgi:hypothetical protein
MKGLQNPLHNAEAKSEAALYGCICSSGKGLKHPALIFGTHRRSVIAHTQLELACGLPNFNRHLPVGRVQTRIFQQITEGYFQQRLIGGHLQRIAINRFGNVERHFKIGILAVYFFDAVEYRFIETRCFLCPLIGRFQS